MKPFMPKLVYFEPGTTPFEDRIEAARKVAGANFPLGFIVAPIYMHEGWEDGYRELFGRLFDALKDLTLLNLSFELIQHRFTKPAKKVIQQRYPNTKLEMDEEKRKYKWGRYGIGKYVYQKDDAVRLEETIRRNSYEYFPNAEIQYFT
ncbi:spore photoproduct lyase [Bacillus pseudomycoides]|nr:spore photoproduct lyase [Bacillus pseudomycoides]AJI16186.1 spore photoproduct lyase [Bacillus pseudomycoides]